MTKLNLEVLGHRVLVKPDVIDEVSEGGIIQIITEKQMRLERAGAKTGIIIELGAGVWPEEDNWVEVGDYVVFSKYGGKPIQDPITEEEYLIMNDEDVLCIIHKEGRD